MLFFAVAKAYSATEESADTLARDIADATGNPVRRIGLESLAGPNHALQLLADIPTWAQVVGGYLTGKVLESFVSQFGSEAASKLIERFRRKPLDTEPLRINNISNLNIIQFTDSIVSNAIGNIGNQTLTIGVPMGTIVSRNIGVEISSLLTGDADRDRLTMLRAAVALIEVSQRVGRPGMIAMAPQNKDCSIKISINEDGTFGGVYEYISYPNVPNQSSPSAPSFGIKRHRLTIKFNASADCIEDIWEEVPYM
ncbi:hypothetical protein [Sphingomonas sp. Leaf4]|uniref:hypothetical protein n=1 Tax=Sphingomonas sp. Leaf4 TaxID=2876553 RepID=UPI001E59E04F|nr:hypothetical protein [Sphingomonas sp. Leaf4]